MFDAYEAVDELIDDINDDYYESFLPNLSKKKRKAEEEEEEKRKREVERKRKRRKKIGVAAGVTLGTAALIGGTSLHKYNKAGRASNEEYRELENKAEKIDRDNKNRVRDFNKKNKKKSFDSSSNPFSAENMKEISNMIKGDKDYSSTRRKQADVLANANKHGRKLIYKN